MPVSTLNSALGNYFYDIPVSFQFDVTVLTLTGPGDCLFQEVSGLNVKLEVDTVQEGGNNIEAYKFPKKTEL